MRALNGLYCSIQSTPRPTRATLLLTSYSVETEFFIVIAAVGRSFPGKHERCGILILNPHTNGYQTIQLEFKPEFDFQLIGSSSINFDRSSAIVLKQNRWHDFYLPSHIGLKKQIQTKK